MIYKGEMGYRLENRFKEYTKGKGGRTMDSLNAKHFIEKNTNLQTY